MTVEEMKRLACEAIDRNADKIIGIGQSIMEEPEMGYKEFKTAEKVKKVFEELGFEYIDKQAVTGVVATAHGRSKKATVAIMGELDAICNFDHPYADKVTGAAHACGHNVQISTMLGTAIALKESGILSELDGDVKLMAVPREEAVELVYRAGLIKEGKIVALGGKQNFIRLGLFDDVDAMVMQHTMTGDKANAGGPGGLGFITKLMNYKGVSCHAAAPWNGVNALTAARLGLENVNAIRETFKDEYGIRWHPIITKGGDLVNVVPSDVRMESYIRGTTMEALNEANFKINRALKAGADAVGAEVEIIDMPGYLFAYESKELKDIVYDNEVALLGEDHAERGNFGGSTDANDVSVLLPTVHARFGGYTGSAHGRDFLPVDKNLAYIEAAKMEVMTVIDLLANGAERALEVKKNFTPQMTKEEYLRDWLKIGADKA
jgi:amidohydrolase